jgi:hypothetical protein
VILRAVDLGGDRQGQQRQRQEKRLHPPRI